MNMQNNEVIIMPYESTFKEDFKRLNEEWIQRYFKLEETDIKVLGDPEKHIIQPGGEIFVALYEGNAVGVCALIKSQEDKFDFELSKMAVTPKVQGKKIGYLLASKIVEEAKNRGGKTLFLDTNSQLLPAVNLYKKLGFQEIEMYEYPYERADVRMVLEL